MRLFLAAHRASEACIRIVQAGFLTNRAARLEHGDLPVNFIMQRPFHKAERVDVLKFGPGAERSFAEWPDGHIGITAERPFLHIAVADFQGPDEGVEFLQISNRFTGRTQIRFGDDFQQRRAGAIQVNPRHFVKVLVKRLSGIFFEMGPGDPDTFTACVRRNLKAAAADNRNLVLTDLITLGQIRVEVIFPGKDRHPIDRCANRKTKSGGHKRSLAVHHRKHAGQADIDCTGLGIGRCTIGGRRS